MISNDAHTHNRPDDTLENARKPLYPQKVQKTPNNTTIPTSLTSTPSMNSQKHVIRARRVNASTSYLPHKHRNCIRQARTCKDVTVLATTVRTLILTQTRTCKRQKIARAKFRARPLSRSCAGKGAQHRTRRCRPRTSSYIDRSFCASDPVRSPLTGVRPALRPPPTLSASPCSLPDFSQICLGF